MSNKDATAIIDPYEGCENGEAGCTHKKTLAQGALISDIMGREGPFVKYADDNFYSLPLRFYFGRRTIVTLGDLVKREVIDWRNRIGAGF